LGGRLVNDIDGPLIREALLPIWLEKPETARRVKQRIGVALDWTYALSDRTPLKILRYAELPYTVHGFRSAFRDWTAEQASHPGEVAKAALAHTVANRVEAVYRRTNYLEKRRPLMADWARFCTDQMLKIAPRIARFRRPSRPIAPRRRQPSRACLSLMSLLGMISPQLGSARGSFDESCRDP
jgi:hypothetical protein